MVGFQEKYFVPAIWFLVAEATSTLIGWSIGAGVADYKQPCDNRPNKYSVENCGAVSSEATWGAVAGAALPATAVLVWASARCLHKFGSVCLVQCGMWGGDDDAGHQAHVAQPEEMAVVRIS